jgi:hypothetical protein
VLACAGGKKHAQHAQITRRDLVLEGYWAPALSRRFEGLRSDRCASACTQGGAVLHFEGGHDDALLNNRPLSRRKRPLQPRDRETIRTARARTSAEYGGTRFVMAPSSQELEPPGNPPRFITRHPGKDSASASAELVWRIARQAAFSRLYQNSVPRSKCSAG